MHYRNGREAKNGDKVIWLGYGDKPIPVAGILYDAVEGIDFCNGKIAPCNSNDVMPNLKDCLRFDDILEAVEPTAKNAK